MNEEFGVLKDMIPACAGQEMHKLAILQVRPCHPATPQHRPPSSSGQWADNVPGDMPRCPVLTPSRLASSTCDTCSNASTT